MAFEHTLSIIKPDGVERQLTGAILSDLEQADLRVVALKLKKLSLDEAQYFYSVHSERPFFNELVTYMTRSPVAVLVLAGENAVTRYREIMGDTNPEKAEAGTLRKKYGLSIGENTVHGSDSLENASKEVRFFFSESDIYTGYYHACD